MAKAGTTSKTSSKKVRAAFIGAGGRAKAAHYPSLDAYSGSEIVAVADMNEERLNAVAGQYDIRGKYTNFVQMIEKEKPEVVYAIMPPHHLYDVAATVMEMGCNLVVEKPPAMTTEQTRQLAIIARKNKVLTAVTFQRRFAPVIREGKAMCEKRGKVHTAVASFYKNWLGKDPYMRGAIDILTSDGIHAVDTLRYMCGGDVVSVASDVRREGADHHTIHLALVKFTTGATGVLLTNWMTGRRFFTIEMHAPGISCMGDPEEGGKVYADDKLEPLAILDPAELGGGKEPFRAFAPYHLNQHISDCIRKGKQPETNFEDATKTMELVDAIYKSQI
ncbi:MAG: Gfo/Idh/MocA family oxidoreductase [bacterium]|nr:Gfo/Idh/MocA family oxidoreductase [bacterium]